LRIRILSKPVIRIAAKLIEKHLETYNAQVVDNQHKTQEVENKNEGGCSWNW